MTRTIKLQNTGRTALAKLSEKEIVEMVNSQADDMLNSLPKELQVADVNSVQLESSLKEVADTGVWAQWTRACCDKRRRIADFIDPVIGELAVDDPRIEKVVFQDHFDSNMVVREVTEPASVKRIGARKRRK